MKLALCIPAHGGQATTALTGSAVAAAGIAAERGGTTATLIADGYSVAQNRSLLTARALADPEVTHLLWLDTDMDVSPAVLRRFFEAEAAGAPMVAAIYPRRRLDLAAFAANVRAGRDDAEALALALDFPLRLPPGKITVRAGFAEVEATGFGCVLTARSVYEAVARDPATPRLTADQARRVGLEGDDHPDAFAEAPLAEGGRLSEDFSFCARVRAAGLPILGWMGEGVSHVGPFAYSAPYEARLRALSRGAPGSA